MKRQSALISIDALTFWLAHNGALLPILNALDGAFSEQLQFLFRRLQHRFYAKIAAAVDSGVRKLPRGLRTVNPSQGAWSKRAPKLVMADPSALGADPGRRVLPNSIANCSFLNQPIRDRSNGAVYNTGRHARRTETLAKRFVGSPCFCASTRTRNELELVKMKKSMIALAVAASVAGVTAAEAVEYNVNLRAESSAFCQLNPSFPGAPTSISKKWDIVSGIVNDETFASAFQVSCNTQANIKAESTNGGMIGDTLGASAFIDYTIVVNPTPVGGDVTGSFPAVDADTTGFTKAAGNLQGLVDVNTGATGYHGPVNYQIKPIQNTVPLAHDVYRDVVKFTVNPL